jgi:L-seryl-tRNA(Ser) seleniumtransferase
MPSVTSIINSISIDTRVHENFLKALINQELDELRAKISNENYDFEKDEIIKKISKTVMEKAKSSFVNIINGTGIVLHTGFGRAPFSGSYLKNIADKINGYSNLEFNLEKNIRGDRQSHIDEHIASICGTEKSVVVNNNAAALLLIINSLSEDAEVICSRGQIVEIGGSFRISEIIKKGGGNLKEVGSTNRTHVEDYENAISKNTKLLLWVHTSNYIMKGYTKEVPLEDIVSIGKKYKIPVVADLGSGSFLDMSKFGLPSEIPVTEIVKKGPDITLFSGDKMLGGPQSGIIVSTKNLIKIIKSNSIYRAVRCDKITIAILDDIIRSYKKNGFLESNLALRLLTQDRKTLKRMAIKIINGVQNNKLQTLFLTIENSMVEAGSGSLPEKNLKSIALKFSPKDMSIDVLSNLFKKYRVPIIGYINKGSFFIDLKAILPSQDSHIIDAINKV